MRAAPLLLLLGVGACGPQPSGPGLRFDFALSAALADTLSGLQVSILSQGKTLDCTAVQLNCLVKQVAATQFVTVQDSTGRDHRALTFPLNLKPGSPSSSQDVAVQGIPLGKDYAVVIEALSKDTPPKLAGSSCNYLAEVTAGTNSTLLAATIKPLMVPLDCDPRVEK